MYIDEITKEQWIGIDGNTSKAQSLSAGKLSMEYVDGRIKNISYKGSVIISEVYFALRDRNWGTIPYEIQYLQILDKGGSFSIEFVAKHNHNGIGFEWNGNICGGENSQISYSFNGVAKSAFLKNRIGFCILHELNCSGMRCSVRHSDNLLEHGVFPINIAPHQPFVDMKSVGVHLSDGAIIDVQFEGDIFEMEDQRNWTDASYKTYCTPLSKPFPLQVEAGDTFSQTLIVSLFEGTEVSATDLGQKTLLSGSDSSYFKSDFSLGSCIVSPLSEAQLKLVSQLGLGHLRYDYHFSETDAEFGEIVAQARLLGLKLLLVVFLSRDTQENIKALSWLLQQHSASIAAILIHRDGCKVIDTDTLSELRHALSSFELPIGSGTDAFFTQINREPIAPSLIDFISYSNNPQVHAFDNDSIMSTVEGQLSNIQSCRALYPDTDIFVSPISLKMRWNPDATSKPVISDFVLPDDVDERQMSLFAACWFIKSIAALLKSNNVSLATYFELVGEKGLFEETVPTSKYSFPSYPNMIYPLTFAFWGIRDIGNAMVKVECDENTAAVWLKHDEKMRVVICNLKNAHTEVPLSACPETMLGLMIDEDNIAELSKLEAPQGAREYFISYNLSGGLRMKPYSIFIAEK